MTDQPAPSSKTPDSDAARAVSDRASSERPAKARPAAPAWTGLLIVLFLAALALFCAVQFRHLAYPLLWQDEGETAMFGQRILEYGYPKVHGPRNIVYGMGLALELGVKESCDAYIGSLWGQYYMAALGAWMAQGVEDIYEKTFLLRLPFALAGSLGLLLLFLAVMPVFGPGVKQRLGAAALYLALAALSISFILHMREVRYYSLAVLLLGIVIWLHFKRTEFHKLGGVSYTVLQVLFLLLLLNTFYPAFVAAGAWLLLEGALRALTTEASQGKRIVSAIRAGLPVLIALAVAVPITLFFEIFEVASHMSARHPFSWAAYASNLGYVGKYFFHHEYLVLFVAAKIGLLLFRILLKEPSRTPVLKTRFRVSNALIRLCIVYVLLGARNPLFFERYFVTLSPLVSLIVVVDLFLLAALARQAVTPENRRLLFVLVMAAAVLGMGETFWIKRSEIKGRLEEMKTPYAGPLDYAIPYLLKKYGDTSRLKIATNYETEPCMYYLGAEVLGRFLSKESLEKGEFVPVEFDVVIPRKWQMVEKAALLQLFITPDAFRMQYFPVFDLPYNNIPELYHGPNILTSHKFVTARVEKGPQRFFLYERIELQ